MAKSKKSASLMKGTPAIRPLSLLLVADSGNARLLRITGSRGSEKLAEIVQMQLPAARQLKQELVADKTGRVFDRGRAGQGPRSTARHGAASDFDPRSAEYERFAKRISRRLDVERRKALRVELVVIAAPRFLGVLRASISPATQRVVAREISKDLVRASDAQLLKAALA